MPLFDRDRYQRLDGNGGGGGGGRRSSPSSCSTATIVLFVALCLVGAWMMSSTGNVPMAVSPEDKPPAVVKEDDASSIDVTDGVKGRGGGGDGGDTPRTTDEAADDVGKKVQDAGDTAKTTDDVGDTGVKGGGVDTQTATDAVAKTTTGGTGAGESGKPAGDKVGDGETTTTSKNQTFSDENGKTEGGEVVSPEDPDKQSADDAPTDGKDTGDQASGDADEAPSTDTKGKKNSTAEEPRDTKDAGENADEASTETKADKSSDDTPTDAKATGDGGTPSKNQTSFDDENGKMDGVETVAEDGKVTEKSSEQVPTNGDDGGGGEAQTTDDDTATGASSNNQTISDMNDDSNTTTTTTTTLAAVDSSNGTDEHEAQVQMALERGIPAISAVMGSKRLPFPGGAYDAVHCARCRVPWHIWGGKLLLEVNRLLRPGGLFVWSATPVYRKTPEDVQIWHDMAALTKSMCWKMVKKTNDTVDETAMVIFKKPTSNGCYSNREKPEPPLCDADDDPDAAWNITLRACMHRLPTNKSVRGARWPELWPERMSAAPYWLSHSQVGVYGKPAPDDFAADEEHWNHVVNSSYLAGVGIDWSNDMNVWVMNVVPVDSADTLPIIYERGLFGMYHDWCESFSTYPRSYDLLHADHLFSKLKKRCKLLPVMVEVDRILRPEGKLIVRDGRDTAAEVESILRSLHWEVRMTVSKQGEVMLCAEKTMWRPKEVEKAATTAS
uniref:Methyltransferase n=1 Tax=Oryza barthii TaxID=65489 RepID=A0A0D3HS14_9ORYZ